MVRSGWLRMTSSVQMKTPGGVAGDFVRDALEVVPFGDGAAERAWRGVNAQAVGFAELVDAEEMGAVADDV